MSVKSVKTGADKAATLVVPPGHQIPGSEELELVHGDLCGPISPPTSAGNAYFLLLVDNMSCFMWLALLHSKLEAPAAIMMFQACVKRETGKKLKVLRTDHGVGSH